MSCLNNIERINFPADLVMDLTKLYQYKGKDFYYADVLKNNLSGIIRITVEKDCTYTAKYLNLSITENRMRLILKKDATPKTKDEKILANLKSVFTLIQNKGKDIELTSNEFLHLATRVFDGVEDIDFASEITKVKKNLFEEKKKISKRSILEDELNKYSRYLNNEEIEPTQLITNLYVDLLNFKIYTSNNEFLSLLIFYSLLFKEGFHVFRYVSFFQLYMQHQKEYEVNTAAANYDWETGYAKTSNLNRLIISTMLEGYDEVERAVANFTFDKRIRKIDNVEATILRLGEVFTKEQIKNAHPQLSASTINRALDNLKKQNKIRSNGTGRSATWIRLVPDDMLGTKMKQMTLFDIMSENTEDE